MGICWYCHWGWPKVVADIYKEAVKKLGGNSDPLHYGPSHIVWSDENFDSAEWCLENFDGYGVRLSEKEKVVVRWSLEELAKIPMNEREVEPEDYDGQNPQNYPPPKGVEMVSDPTALRNLLRRLLQMKIGI
jgi:hypothetical protein